MAFPILALPVSPQPLKVNKLDKFKVTTAIALALTAVIVPISQKEKNPCRVEIAYPHVSTYFARKTGVDVVKVNAYSVCNRPHSRVTLTVRLWKEETVFKKIVAETISRHPGTLRANERFYNQETFAFCKSKNETLYYGIAYAKAFIDGKWHFATHKLDISTPVKCGT